MEYLSITLDNSELSSKGCLKKYANPALISEESGAWARAVEINEANRRAMEDIEAGRLFTADEVKKYIREQGQTDLK